MSENRANIIEDGMGSQAYFGVLFGVRRLGAALRLLPGSAA
jgi:hypothetical protein